MVSPRLPARATAATNQTSQLIGEAAETWGGYPEEGDGIVAIGMVLLFNNCLPIRNLDSPIILQGAYFWPFNFRMKSKHFPIFRNLQQKPSGSASDPLH